MTISTIAIASEAVGATPFEAQKAAGHAKPDTTWLYTITDAQREREQVRRILDRIIDPNKSAISPEKKQ